MPPIKLIDEFGLLSNPYLEDDEIISETGLILNPNLEDDESAGNVGEEQYDNLIRKIQSGRFDIPVESDPNDMFYAQFAKDSYNKISSRNNIDNFIYKEEDSTEKFGTYIGDEEIVIGIKGTDPTSGIKDFQINTGYLLGSAGGQQVATLQTLPVQQKINDLKKKFPNKKLTVTGHSQAGATASLLGVDNPDIDVVSFNREVGLPFISSTVRCSIFGCKNVRNYRVAGDFASASFFKNPGIGSTFTVAPKIPDLETQFEAQSKESFFIPADLYIPHSINNFIDRRRDNLAPDYNVFGRTLARRVGAVTGAALPFLVKPAISKVAERLKTFEMAKPERSQQILKELVDADEFDIAVDYLEYPEQLSEVIKKRVEKEFKPFDEVLSYTGGAFSGINKVISSGISGGLGSIAGVAIYENLLAGEVDDL